jgi:hypothetical protein
MRMFLACKNPEFCKDNPVDMLSMRAPEICKSLQPINKSPVAERFSFTSSKYRLADSVA